MNTIIKDNKGGDLLSLTEISKEFPGVVALDKVSFDLAPSEVHVLFGENGAGKSTLINIIAGTLQRDEGRYWYKGQEIVKLTPSAARSLGIGAVFQEFSLAPDLTVWENLFLGREIDIWGLLSRSRMRKDARRLLEKLDFKIRETSYIRDLNRSERQMVEIAKAVAEHVQILILDEPTASLTEQETGRLFETIEQLKSSGVGIIYVSHRLAEIQRISDRITVLRDGQNVTTVDTSAVDDNQLVELMTGRKTKSFFPTISRGKTVPMLEISDLTTKSRKVMDVSIEVRAGEVVGLAGLVGCGKSDVARAVFGLERIDSGKIVLDGLEITGICPSSMIDQGVCYFPSDRAEEGLALNRPIRENASISVIRMPHMRRLGLLRLGDEVEQVEQVAKRIQLRPLEIERSVLELSGGNRQKVMLMRGLMHVTRVFLFDEPTVGIDVGAKIEIYNLIKELTERGAAVLVVSSDMAEILQLCQRTYVMCEGRITATLDDNEKTEERILKASFSQEVRRERRS